MDLNQGYTEIFLGEPGSHLIELQKGLQSQSPLDVSGLLREIATLRGKISHYEGQLKELTQIARL